ncbi:hypothetical protein FHW72_002319 [Ochrobactrum sp. RC6B]|nr:hypothetical protein [Ochrobactrum sp. RC6B]
METYIFIPAPFILHAYAIKTSSFSSSETDMRGKHYLVNRGGHDGPTLYSRGGGLAPDVTPERRSLAGTQIFVA